MRQLTDAERLALAGLFTASRGQRHEVGPASSGACPSRRRHGVEPRLQLAVVVTSCQYMSESCAAGAPRGTPRIQLATASPTPIATTHMDLDPGLDAILREIPAIKDDLQVNVELASPAHFIPELPGWRDRRPFIVREGWIDFHHYDFYAQALAKIERAHARDLEDVREMAADGLIVSRQAPGRQKRFFEQIAAGAAPFPGPRTDPSLVPAGCGTRGSQTLSG